MIINCHGHYTTAPKAHDQWRVRRVYPWLDVSLKARGL